ncbi:MAG: hypothetical protein QW359_00145 [Metallosphaera sp.]
MLKGVNNIAKRQVIISTPVMEIIQPTNEYELNPFQKHKSAWHPEEMKKLGFRGIGLRGIKTLFSEARQAGVSYRIKHPILRPLFVVLRKISQLFVYHFPNIAHQQLCIKNKTPH